MEMLEEIDIDEINSQFNDPIFVAEFRLQMVKFASLQLNDSHLAEDAVQDALMGALKNMKTFSGKSAFKTWVYAILKNKIADILRKRQRYVGEDDFLGDDGGDEHFADVFRSNGRWQEAARPINWGDPENSFSQEQFWAVFEVCLNNLPAKQGRVFMMREFIGLETEEICNEMDLSVTNLHVLLHRSRLKLQRCLELNWFGGGKIA